MKRAYCPVYLFSTPLVSGHMFKTYEIQWICRSLPAYHDILALIRKQAAMILAHSFRSLSSREQGRAVLTMVVCARYTCARYFIEHIFYFCDQEREPFFIPDGAKCTLLYDNILWYRFCSHYDCGGHYSSLWNVLICTDIAILSSYRIGLFMLPCHWITTTNMHSMALTPTEPANHGNRKMFPGTLNQWFF